LVDFVLKEAERIDFGPSAPSQEPKREDAWSDLGYERRERDRERWLSVLGAPEARGR
jgi:hypothetical protein